LRLGQEPAEQFGAGEHPTAATATPANALPSTPDLPPALSTSSAIDFEVTAWPIWPASFWIADRPPRNDGTRLM
jgi:hypothetical protein